MTNFVKSCVIMWQGDLVTRDQLYKSSNDCTRVIMAYFFEFSPEVIYQLGAAHKADCLSCEHFGTDYVVCQPTCSFSKD